MSSLVRDARLAEGLTQTQLARRMGITQPSVARLESAGDNVTIATLRRALIPLGRDLEMRAVPLDIDEAALKRNLRLTPEQRLVKHAVRILREEAG